jgi:hypothetical protein
LGLKTGAGARCGWAARRVSRFGPQNLEWRPVRPDGQEGFLVWSSKPGVAPGAVGRPGGFGSLGLKTTKVAGFSVWASKLRLAPGEAGRPENVPRHVVEWFRWFGPQNHHRRGFPGFDSKPGSGPGLTRRPRGHLAHTRWTRGGEELMPITRGRPMGEKGKMDENAPAWVV